jgi:hypothetical protein
MNLKQWIGHRLASLCLVVLQFVALLLITLPILPDHSFHVFDMGHYYNISLNLMEGKWPYRDFLLEYPPLAILPFVLPQLASFDNLLDYGDYLLVFLGESAVFTTLIALLTERVASCRRTQLGSVVALSIYVLLVAISAPLLPWRYDLFPALLTQLAFVSVLANRSTVAGFWMGLAIAAKIYPVVLVPIFSAYYVAGRQYRELAILLVATLAVIGLIFIPFILNIPGELLSFVSYHKLRGLQIESLPAGIISLGHLLGLTKVSTVINYGAAHLVSPLADSVLKWLPFVCVLTLGVVWASCLLRFQEERAITGQISFESLVAYTTAALLTFMATNKVFSPQYIVWLLPFAPLLPLRQAGLIVGIYAITIIFRFVTGGLRTMYAVSVLLLNLRNLLVVALILWLVAEHGPAPMRIALLRLRRTLSRRLAKW